MPFRAAIFVRKQTEIGRTEIGRETPCRSRQRTSASHFRKLHETRLLRDARIPWDAGSAQGAAGHLGFKALASTSAGFAWSIGKADNRVTLDEVCEHLDRAVQRRSICRVNADFEGGFAHEPEQVAANVARAVKTGVAGLSIEDSTGDKAKPLYERGLGDRAHRGRRARRSMLTIAGCCWSAAARAF